MSENFNLIKETKERAPRLPFLAMKEAALGKKYKLNLIFSTPTKIKKLNTIYRNKEYATDILSFPIGDNEGEIYISLSESKKEAVKFDREFKNFVAFLFIHGCIHLKGYDHGSTMEKLEAKIRRRFGI